MNGAFMVIDTKEFYPNITNKKRRRVMKRRIGKRIHILMQFSGRDVSLA